MFCHRCGQPLPLDALFCNHCGTKIQNSAASTSTPSPRVTIQFEPNDPNPPRPSQNPYEGSGYSSPSNMLSNDSVFTVGQFSPGPNTSPGHISEGLQFLPPRDNQPALIPPQPAAISETQFPPFWQPPAIAPVQQPVPSPVVHPPIVASNKVQQLLLRVFGTNIAERSLFGIALGGILAALAGLLVTSLLLSIFHAIAPQNTALVNGITGEDVINYALGIVPLHNLYRDSLQLFLIMHGVGTHVQYTNSSSAYFSTTDNYFPLSGLLIVPAVLLILGGYIAASTDFHDRLAHSLWRGVGIAIPYTLILFIMASQANGCIPGNGTGYSASFCQNLPTSVVNTLTIDNPTLLFFGLLYGSLFGLIGASLKIARGRWRHMVIHFLRSTTRPQLLGAFVGSLTALAESCLMGYCEWAIARLQSTVFLVWGTA